MNLLTGTISWDLPRTGVSIQDYVFTDGRLKLEVTRFKNQKHDKRNYHYNPATEILITLLGQITNLKEIKRQYLITLDSDMEIVENLYNIKGASFIEELDGTFLISVSDRQKSKCYVFQSWAGYSLPIYYVSRNNCFYFSTSLRALLDALPFSPELDVAGVRDFLHYGLMIPNHLTMIKEVSKLVCGNYLAIDLESRSFDILSYNPNRMRVSAAVAENRLVDSIGWCVRSLAEQLEDNFVTLTLTGGWDTNLILHYFQQCNKAPLRAVTVNGGGAVTDEVAMAKNTLAYYKDIEHFATAVTEDTILSLPDIVSRCEGYPFDEGIFLRYELGQLLQRVGCESVFMGVGADQILFPETTFKKALRLIRNKIVNYRKGLWRPGRGCSLANRYDIYIDYNLKMHGIMLNSFGIEGYYPFLNLTTSAMSQALGFKRSFRKKLYKQQVAKTLDPRIVENIKKSSAVSDPSPFFIKNRNLFLEIVRSSFAAGILNGGDIDKLLSDSNRQYLLICQLAYVFLFNEIFIKGKSVPETKEVFCKKKISSIASKAENQIMIEN